MYRLKYNSSFVLYYINGQKNEKVKGLTENNLKIYCSKYSFIIKEKNY